MKDDNCVEFWICDHCQTKFDRVREDNPNRCIMCGHKLIKGRRYESMERP